MTSIIEDFKDIKEKLEALDSKQKPTITPMPDEFSAEQHAAAQRILEIYLNGIYGQATVSGGFGISQNYDTVPSPDGQISDANGVGSGPYNISIGISKDPDPSWSPKVTTRELAGGGTSTIIEPLPGTYQGTDPSWDPEKPTEEELDGLLGWQTYALDVFIGYEMCPAIAHMPVKPLNTDKVKAYHDYIKKHGLVLT